jgi:hypothetical protein
MHCHLKKYEKVNMFLKGKGEGWDRKFSPESLLPLLEQVQIVEAVDVYGDLVRRLHDNRPTPVQESPHGGDATPARPPTPPPAPVRLVRPPLNDLFFLAPLVGCPTTFSMPTNDRTD